VQVDVRGDAGVDGTTDNTLRAKRRAQQSCASGCEEPGGKRHERMAPINRGSRWSSWYLGKERTRRGERPRVRFNRRIRGTHRFAEECLEVDGRAHGSRLAGECASRNGMEASDGDESSHAADRENPLDGARTLDVAAG